ncbi:hypothetical protein CTA1_3128 [Colletotrichum tanaceti]|uniref:Uncharacterized protein n=1 Tax=Colletotrichum tanaceti TaxID=1306861 RepID=A0A4U6XVR3_9PEZI|nr:hypothetical protein CTA1_3128 [Colletotrichum tanaceti]
MPADRESHHVTLSKRRRLRSGLIDPNATPRAILPTDSALQTGSAVSTSSPAKQMMALQLNEYLLDIASIDLLETMPQLARELVSVLAAIDGFANGHNVIPTSHRDQLFMLDAVKHLCGWSGYNTVNHMSYFYLRNNPVSVSVKSKRPGGSVDDAHLARCLMGFSGRSHGQDRLDPSGSAVSPWADRAGRALVLRCDNTGREEDDSMDETSNRNHLECLRRIQGHPDDPVPCLVDGNVLLALVRVQRSRFAGRRVSSSV